MRVFPLKSTALHLPTPLHCRAGDSCAYLGCWAPGSPDWEEVAMEERDRVGAGRWGGVTPLHYGVKMG